MMMMRMDRSASTPNMIDFASQMRTRTRKEMTTMTMMMRRIGSRR